MLLIAFINSIDNLIFSSLGLRGGPDTTDPPPPPPPPPPPCIRHCALDITVTSPLIPSILTAASLSEGAAAEEAEARKHRANDPKCSELGWLCIPLAVETYGNWGREAQTTFSRLASHLAITTSSHKGKVLTEMYSRLNFTLVRAVARALLARCAPSLGPMDFP